MNALALTELHVQRGPEPPAKAAKPVVSTSTLGNHAPPAGVAEFLGLRLGLKPVHQPSGHVQGAWWPRSTQLATELPQLLAALASRSGSIDRVVYDERAWATAPSHLRSEGRDVKLCSSSDRSINTISLIGDQVGQLVLLVVPPYTQPSRAYTAVMTAARSGDESTTDELLGIGKRAAEDRRSALMAHQRWDTAGGALPRRRQDPADRSTR